MKPLYQYLLTALTLAGILTSGPALATIVYASAHLNLRTGPGTQYPIVGVMEWGTPATATGCLADFSWCSVTVGSLSGWAASPYLDVQRGILLENVAKHGPATRIPVVAAEGIAEVVAAPSVGVVVAANGRFQAIVPEPAVLEYIAATPVSPFAVEGEIVVGAVVPAAVELYAVPGSQYGYTVVNGARVLVDTGTREIVYIHR